MSGNVDREIVRAGPRGRVQRVLLASLITSAVIAVYVNNARAHLRGQSGDTDSNQQLPLVLLTGRGFVFDSLYSGAAYPYAMVRVRDHIVSNYPILPGLINTITFAAAQMIGQKNLRADRAYLSFLTGSVVSAMSVGVVFLILEREGLVWLGSVSLALLYAFGTTVFSVASRGIWQHGPALLFLAVGLSLFEYQRNLPFALAGLAFGLAVETRVPVVVLIAPLVLLALKRERRAFAGFVVSFLLPIALMRLYAWQYWGSPFKFVEYPVSTASSFVGRNPFEGLAGVLISPGRGILVYSPFVVFGVLGALAAFRKRELVRLALALGVALYIVMVAFWSNWWGGKSFGYRMLTEILPFAIYLGAAPMASWYRRKGWWLVAVLITSAWALLVNYAGARYYPRVPSRGDDERSTAWSVGDSELVQCLEAMSVSVSGYLHRPLQRGSGTAPPVAPAEALLSASGEQ